MSLAVADQLVAFSGDRAIPAAVHRVEVQQVLQVRRLASRIVDLHELELGAIRGCTQDEAAHAAEPVDANTNGHESVSGQGNDRDNGARQRASEFGPERSSPRDRRALPGAAIRSGEHTSELQSIMSSSYAVFFLKKK